MTVEDRDLGYANLLRGLGNLGGRAVDVGILQDKGGEDAGGITLAGYAAVNEFGSSDGRVPERSFLRSTVDENADKYGDKMNRAVARAIDVAIGGGDAGAALDLELGKVGLLAARDVKGKIRDIRSPPNAPATLARKYPGDNPLIDTGRMRRSIAHQVVKVS